MGHFQFPLVVSQGQSPDPLSGHPCSRQCLLKGCERWFLPRHFQDCYCSPECRIAARRWRRWHAARRYRATTHGKQRRREQARRHRERKQLQSALNETALPTPEDEPASSTIAADVPPLIDLPTVIDSLGVGQRQAKFLRILGSGPAAGRVATSSSACHRVLPSGRSALAHAARLYDVSGSGKRGFESGGVTVAQGDGPVIKHRPRRSRYVVTY